MTAEVAVPQSTHKGERMRYIRFAVVVLLVPLALAGCQTAKAWWSGSPDTVTRILADIGCITALTTAAVQVQGDPAVNGAKTALGVLNAIAVVGNSNIPTTVLAACKDTLALAPKDAEGAAVVVAAAEGSTLPKASPPKMATAPPPQPKTPTPVVIPVPRK